jgi:hypothetical protein
VLRIPKSVVEKFLLKRGGPVEITTPVRPRRRKASASDPLDEDELVRQLAGMTRQHGAEAQRTLDRIAERARLLKFVPESQWQDVVWVDEESDL